MARRWRAERRRGASGQSDTVTAGDRRAPTCPAIRFPAAAGRDAAVATTAAGREEERCRGDRAAGREAADVVAAGASVAVEPTPALRAAAPPAGCTVPAGGCLMS